MMAVLVLAASGAAAAADTVATAATLWQIVQSGSLPKVQAYLATPGVDVNDRLLVGSAQDDPHLLVNDKSLLDFAAEANQLEIATYLLDHGARANEPQQQGLDKGITALHRAAFFDAAEIAELLITRGANVNAKHGTVANGLGGATPLHYAAVHGSLKAARVLLQHGADATAVMVSGETAISQAIKYNHADAVDLVRAYLHESRVESLVDAARNGELEFAQKALVSRSAQSDLDTALQLVLIAGSDRPDERAKIVQLLISHGAHVDVGATGGGASIIELANTPEIAKTLIAKGADPGSARFPGAPAFTVACNPVVTDPVGVLKVLFAHGGQMPTDAKLARAMMHCAVVARRQDLVDYLLQQDLKADTRDAAGRTLLFEATDGPMVELLIEHGIGIDAHDNAGESALGHAVRSGHTQVGVALIKAGAKADTTELSILPAAARAKQGSVVAALVNNAIDVNARDADDRTALFWAVDAKDYWSARALIEHGSDVNATDQKGSTPLHVAALHNDARLVSYLLEQHANPALRDKAGLRPMDRATTEDVRNLLAIQSTAWDESLSGAEAAACSEVARRAGEGSLGHIAVFGEVANEQRDPKDNWSFLDEVPARYQVKLAGRSYVLSSDSGPVYLSRITATGVEGVVCEFALIPSSDPPSYRVLAPDERLPGDLANGRKR